MTDLARTAPTLTAPWEVPAPLLALLVQAVHNAGPHTRTVGLQLIDRGRAGHIQVDVAQARRWLQGASESVELDVDRGRGIERHTSRRAP